MNSPSEVKIAFTKALPKAELHAHFSGSISRETLHEIWLDKREQGFCLDLEDPMIAIQTGNDGFVDVVSFFPIFDKYIYNLCNDLRSVKHAVEKVISDFEADGVRYLELRTTPRECHETGMTMEAYIGLVNSTIYGWNQKAESNIEIYLILSIDRRMSSKQAMRVMDLAIAHQKLDKNSTGCVVGADLCGNPSKGNVDVFTPAFKRAKNCGLGITVHFAETPASGTEKELTTILSWYPDRLGHSIHVPPKIKDIICDRLLGLEMCLSCNVLTGLTQRGFANHHLNEWLQRDCPIALSTDDVGIFGSPLSNEYLLAARTFALSKSDLCKLSRDAVKVAFAGTQRMNRLLDVFETIRIL